MDIETLKAIAEKYRTLEAEHAAAKAVASDLYAQFQKVKWVDLPEAMAEMEMTDATLEGIGKIRLKSVIGAKVVDKEAVIEWLETNGLGDLVTITVNSSTLNSLAAARDKEGNPLPSDLFDVTRRVAANITKS